MQNCCRNAQALSKKGFFFNFGAAGSQRYTPRYSWSSLECLPFCERVNLRAEWRRPSQGQIVRQNETRERSHHLR